MCSETSSPRLSFSNDVGQTDVLPLQQDHRRDTTLLDLSCDFEFSFISSFSGQESSSADELFSHGIILPTQPIERPNNTQKLFSTSLPPLPTFPANPKREKKPKKITTTVLNSHIHNNSDHQDKPQPQSQCAQQCQTGTKSFWGNFKRSNSLNCENKRGLLFSLPLLSRSNSTGSVPTQKRNSFKEANKNSTNSQKQPLTPIARSLSSSSSSSSSLSNSYSTLQKPPLKKSYGGSYGNGVRVIPVINVPPPYISKGTAKFFGLGSFLHHGKERKIKK